MVIVIVIIIIIMTMIEITFSASYHSLHLPARSLSNCKIFNPTNAIHHHNFSSPSPSSPSSSSSSSVSSSSVSSLQTCSPAYTRMDNCPTVNLPQKYTAHHCSSSEIQIQIHSELCNKTNCTAHKKNRNAMLRNTLQTSNALITAQKKLHSTTKYDSCTKIQIHSEPCSQICCKTLQ